jgi:hypothetical protein
MPPPVKYEGGAAAAALRCEATMPSVDGIRPGRPSAPRWWRPS